MRRRRPKKVPLPIGIHWPELRRRTKTGFVFDRKGEGCVSKCVTIVDDASTEASWLAHAVGFHWVIK